MNHELAKWCPTLKKILNDAELMCQRSKLTTNSGQVRKRKGKHKTKQSVLLFSHCNIAVSSLYRLDWSSSLISPKHALRLALAIMGSLLLCRVDLVDASLWCCCQAHALSRLSCPFSPFSRVTSELLRRRGSILGLIHEMDKHNYRYNNKIFHWKT